MIPANSILQHLIELIGNVTDAHTVALFTMEPGGKTLAMREHFSLSNNLDPGAKIPVGKGPIGVTAQTRKSHLIENFDQNTRFLCFCSTKRWLGRQRARSAKGCSIILWSDRCTTLSVSTKKMRR